MLTCSTKKTGHSGDDPVEEVGGSYLGLKILLADGPGRREEYTMKVFRKLFVDCKTESMIWKDFVDEIVTGLADTISKILPEV
jgi:hypothetical protein